MDPAVVRQVECVQGCGGGTHVLTFILGLVGLIVALISAGLAWRAMRASDESAKAAQASLEIAKEQHAQFMQERHARADFSLKLSLPKYPDALVETKAGRVKLAWVLEVINIGDKPASRVNVHFEAPQEVEELKWVTGENDSLHTQRAGPFLRKSEKVTTADGTSYPSQFLAKIVDHIGTRRGPRFSHVSGYVNVPPLGQELVIPVEMSVWSDDMGEEPMRETSLDVTIRRVS